MEEPVLKGLGSVIWSSFQTVSALVCVDFFTCIVAVVVRMMFGGGRVAGKAGMTAPTLFNLHLRLRH
jgi:hypothetical protein